MSIQEVKNYYKNPDGSDGNLKEHYYTKEGIYHGEFISYYSTGHLYIVTTFKDGKRHGVYKDYYPNGSLKIDAVYDNDLKVIHKDYYIGPENGIGNLKVVVRCKNGLYDGPYRAFYDMLPSEEPSGFIESIPHGILKEESNDLNGKPHGIVKMYHRNGKLKQQTIMNHGVPRGITKFYDESGNQISEINYDEISRLFSLIGRL
jgi:antitoxin component YwqK of YwqJK toxin-antitoxin module